MPRELNGTVSNIRYKNENGFTVAEISGEESIVAVGSMPELQVGESARFFGEYKSHPKYGMQFAVTSYRRSLPSDLNDAILFLSGGFIKGLGNVLSTRIVETFKENTFDVIEKSPQMLTQVKGVSQKLADSIHDALSQYSDKKYAYAELMGLGLTARQAALAEAALGSDAAAKVRENPYILIPNVSGINFITADAIAQRLGVNPESPFRLRHGVLNALNEMLDRGDMYAFRTSLENEVAQKLNVDIDKVKSALMELCAEKSTVIKKYAKNFEAVYTYSSYSAEAEVASRLIKMSAAKAERQPYNIEEQLKFQNMRLSLTEEQINAVKTAVSNSVCVLTGGPGTGKTTILDAILHILGASGISCALAAPTGRAAKRMQEATGEEARTIHRLLEYAYDEDAYQCYFRRNEENPLDYDAVIVDEVSMLDTFLMRNLLRAIKPGARLILVGDADQLPSVGPGNIMRDIIASGAIKKVRLTHRFRNAGKIADAAYDILQGDAPDFDTGEFVFIPCDDCGQVADVLKHTYAGYINNGADVQVIAPVKRAELGTEKLNETLREYVNPMDGDKTELTYGDKLFRTGDRVMQMKNNYGRKWKNYNELTQGEGVFNGDIGVITGIRQGNLSVRFEDGKCCDYNTEDLNELGAAFAYTIHKSQGSEFDVVIIPMMYPAYSAFFTRNLLYTAVTRAKRAVVLIGSKDTFNYMVKNDNRTARKTGLAMELKRLAKIFPQDV